MKQIFYLLLLLVIAGNLRPEKIGTSNQRHLSKGNYLNLRDANPAMRWQMKWKRVE